VDPAKVISRNGTIIHHLVAAKNLSMEAVVAMAIVSVPWRNVKGSVFIVKSCYLLAMIQLSPTKVLSSILGIMGRNNVPFRVLGYGTFCLLWIGLNVTVKKTLVIFSVQ